jgi:regulatory helix-turn-helix LysR family protein
MTKAGIRDDRQHAAKAIELQQLRFAVVACDYRSFRRAAESLSIKHNVLSRSICQLEHLVGASLFERSSGGIKPTLAGRAVLRIARLILEQVDMLVDTGRSGGRGDAGHLVIGFYTSMSTGNLRATIGELKMLLPQLELATVERSRFRLVTALHDFTGAGEGNRTLVFSLEGCCSMARARRLTAAIPASGRRRVVEARTGQCVPLAKPPLHMLTVYCIKLLPKGRARRHPESFPKPDGDSEQNASTADIGRRRRHGADPAGKANRLLIERGVAR